MKMGNLNHEFKMRITLHPYNDEDNKTQSLIIDYKNNAKCFKDIYQVMDIWENIASSVDGCARFEIYDNAGLHYFSQFYDYGYDEPYETNDGVEPFEDLNKTNSNIEYYHEEEKYGCYHYKSNSFIHNFRNNLI